MIVPVCDIGVYHDSGTSLWHFDQLNDHCYRFNQKDYFQYPENLTNFIQSNYKLKFAGFHVPFPEDESWLERYHQVKKFVAHIFIFCSELHPKTVEQLISLDFPNTSIFICGYIDYEFKYAKIHQWMDWFITTAYFYSTVKPNLLTEKLKFEIKKQYFFDILLGCRRTHRDFIFNYINLNKLNQFVLMTYHQRADLDLRLSNEYIFEEDNCEFIKDTYNHTVDPVIYYNTHMSLSQVLPFSIYNKCYYSIVAETNCSNDFNFYTEKIVKPILAKRLFVVIAGKGYLKNLRNLGFKTFNSILDESYDNETDPEIRWTMAMSQLEYLFTQNPEVIYDKIKDIVEHNQRLMLTNNWYRSFSINLKLTIDPYLTSAHKVDS